MRFSCEANADLNLGQSTGLVNETGALFFARKGGFISPAAAQHERTISSTSGTMDSASRARYGATC
jgi:hypothetical protein